MPPELTPGVIVPIPCRACGEAFVKFEIAPGRHTLKCPRCGGVTIVTVSLDQAKEWRLRTREEKDKVANARGR